MPASCTGSTALQGVASDLLTPWRGGKVPARYDTWDFGSNSKEISLLLEPCCLLAVEQRSLLVTVGGCLIVAI